MKLERPTSRPRNAQSGFTLVETLVAIVVLVFGLIAVTNLLLVAAGSNALGNQGTAAVTSSTTVMDMLKRTSFANLAPGGMAWEWPPAAAKACGDPTLTVNDWHCSEFVRGVGLVHTHWWITATAEPRLLSINTRSQGLGALTSERSRALFTTFRACTNSDKTTGGCPAQPPPTQVLP